MIKIFSYEKDTLSSEDDVNKQNYISRFVLYKPQHDINLGGVQNIDQSFNDILEELIILDCQIYSCYKW